MKSFENDDAADALDAGFERVHGAEYDALMDDGSPLSFDQVQRQLADSRTLAAAIDALGELSGASVEDWDELEQLAFAGIVVRHAEFGVAIPDDWRARAIEWLEGESIDWPEEATLRRLRRDRELALLRGKAASP